MSDSDYMAGFLDGLRVGFNAGLNKGLEAANGAYLDGYRDGKRHFSLGLPPPSKELFLGRDSHALPLRGLPAAKQLPPLKPAPIPLLPKREPPSLPISKRSDLRLPDSLGWKRKPFDL